MSGTKRTYSTAFPVESPPKLTKKATSTKDELVRPSLHRASTLPVVDDDEVVAKVARAPSKRASTASKGRPSLTKKTSSFEKGSLVSKLSGLKSGSIVGTTSAPPPAPPLVKKASSVKVPSIPSGLTKLAMSKCGSKGSIRVYGSEFIDDVDETEMAAALESLKSTLSTSGSKTSLAKSASKTSLSKSASKTSLSKSASKASLSKSASKASLSTSASVSSTGSASNADDAEASLGPMAPPLPPGGLMEVAISFDTTGSMYRCLAEVRAKVKGLVQRLQADIPGIRIAIIAHGDYCDANTYIIQWIDFGASLPELCDFVKKVKRTMGGDRAECYELVLLRTREALSWTPGSKRALIMINDDEPHPPGYRYGQNTYFIDWREECAELAKMGVTIYGVQSGSWEHSTKFNKEMTELTGGKHLQLKDFNSIFDFIMMICYREANPDMIPIYAEEMVARKKRLADAEAVALDFGTASKPMAFGAPSKPMATFFGTQSIAPVPLSSPFQPFPTFQVPEVANKGRARKVPAKKPKTATLLGPPSTTPDPLSAPFPSHFPSPFPPFPTSAVPVVTKKGRAKKVPAKKQKTATLFGSPSTATATLSAPFPSLFPSPFPTSAVPVVTKKGRAKKVPAKKQKTATLFGSPSTATATLSAPFPSLFPSPFPTSAVPVVTKKGRTKKVPAKKQKTATLFGSPSTATATLSAPFPSLFPSPFPTSAVPVVTKKGRARKVPAKKQKTATLFGSPSTATLSAPFPSLFPSPFPTSAVPVVTKKGRAKKVPAKKQKTATLFGSPSTATATLTAPYPSHFLSPFPTSAVPVFTKKGRARKVSAKKQKTAILFGSPSKAPDPLSAPFPSHFPSPFPSTAMATLSAPFANPGMAMSSMFGVPSKAPHPLSAPFPSHFPPHFPSTVPDTLSSPFPAPVMAKKGRARKVSAKKQKTATLFGTPSTAPHPLSAPFPSHFPSPFPSTVPATLSSPFPAPVIAKKGRARKVSAKKQKTATLFGTPSTTPHPLSTPFPSHFPSPFPSTVPATLSSPFPAPVIAKKGRARKVSAKKQKTATLFGSPSKAPDPLSAPIPSHFPSPFPSTATATLSAPFAYPGMAMSSMFGVPSKAPHPFSAPFPSHFPPHFPTTVPATLSSPFPAPVMAKKGRARKVSAKKQKTATLLGSPSTAPDPLSAPFPSHFPPPFPTTVPATLSAPFPVPGMAMPSMFGYPSKAPFSLFGAPSKAPVQLSAPFPVQGVAKKIRAGKVSAKKSKTAANTAKKVKAATKGGKAVKKGKGKERKVDSVEKRELVMDAKLSMGNLKGLTWSKWVKAMAPGAVPSKGKGSKAKDPNYVACRNYPAYRLTTLFGITSSEPALYEFALTAPGVKAGKKYVVYFRKSGGFDKTWSSCLLENAVVRKELTHCLTAGCSLWVRKGVTKGRSKAVVYKKITQAADVIKRNYDYAWKKYIWRRVGTNMCHRELATKKGCGHGVVLSHGDW